ncbi:MAG: large conductance mechanosensitive channel protein MscL [Leptolyngbyaceae bacterium]|nr:large conductance mechanosensitive channel protein MscL [Leptolyngbyaceae bacterium]
MTVRRGRRAATGFFADFRDFIMRGNVVDLAVAVIIGGAFGKIIESFVADIITPAILTPAMQKAGVEKLADLTANGIQYGLFLAAIINFIVIAFCMFLVVRFYESAKKRIIREEEVEVAPDPAIVAQENLTQAVERLTEVMERRT